MIVISRTSPFGRVSKVYCEGTESRKAHFAGFVLLTQLQTRSLIVPREGRFPEGKGVLKPASFRHSIPLSLLRAFGDGKKASEAEEAILGRVSVNLGQIESTEEGRARFNLNFPFTRSIIGRLFSHVDLWKEF